MTYIIVTRNPATKRLVVIHEASDDFDGPIAEFETEQDADIAASKLPLCQAWGYEAVEVADIL